MANKMEANKIANKIEANKIEANKIETVKPVKKRTKKIEKAEKLAEKQPAEKKPAEKQPAEKQPAEQKSTVSIVLIETNGTIKTLKTKEITEDTLYKKCGFRVSDDFLCRHTWTVKLKNITDEPMTISVWAKKTGKANFENKYDMPPPLDKELFFGTCAIVRTASDKASSKAANSKSTFLDLTKETWLKIYEQLFGGFEDIGEEDEYSEDELENVDPKLLTSHGYLKDGFVVSDKEVSASTSEADASEADANTSASASEAEADTEAEASEADTEAEAEASEADAEPEIVVKKKVVKKVAQKVAQKKIGKVKAKKQVVEEEEYKDDTSELEEEVYTFSDDD
jgi:hypothetical protein